MNQDIDDAINLKLRGKKDSKLTTEEEEKEQQFVLANQKEVIPLLGTKAKLHLKYAVLHGSSLILYEEIPTTFLNKSGISTGLQKQEFVI